MIGLPRNTSAIVRRIPLIAASLTLALCAVLRAQDAPAPITVATVPAVDKELKSTISDFWHFAKVRRYELAVQQGQKILATNADPQLVLTAFEQVALEHQDGARMDALLLQWQGVEPMRETTEGIIKLISEGYRARRSDPKNILDNISRLNVNDRAYGLAMSRLYESGELAVPFMIDILRDPARRNSNPTIRRALRDLGRNGLNPLVAVTETRDWEMLTTVLGVLGDLGYDAAAPYVARIYESPDAPDAVKAAASSALAKLGVVRAQGGQASDLFLQLGQKVYNHESSLAADTRFPKANIWYWSDQGGLTRKEVPHAIFNDIMAMRECEYAVKLAGGRGDEAMSLWLAANYRREADLPEGQIDPTRDEGNPSAHYWGVQTGTRYLNVSLARALRDHNSAVAFRAIRSLQEIVGQSNLFNDNSSRPLIDAMQYSDRKVRFEAALALAGALPQTRYEGQQRVIPILAEAVSQTGQPSVLVVLPTQDAVNKLVEDLKTNGYAATGSTTGEGAVSMAATLPAVDVIIVAEQIGPGNVDQLFNMANANARLAGAARLVITQTNASLYEPRKVSDPLLSTSTATDAAGLKPAIEEARTKAGSLPLDAEIATQYATRAAEMMIKVGISRGQVYDLMPAKQTLLAALSDSRPEIVMLAGQALALVSSPEAQAGLLTVASDDKTADDVKISLYKSLATSAKFFGNDLDGNGIATLEKVVADAPNLDVRSAAAEARGALNLPADQAKSLIVKQSKT